VFIQRTDLHPTAALLVWLIAVVTAQFVGYPVLGLMALVVLFAGSSVMALWWRYVSRGRWLLLSLWLILAYGTSGEAFMNLLWAPTLEGVADANLQTARILFMLLCLARLFATLGREGLIAGLWGMMLPFRHLGLDIERLVVRLSLVLENLKTPPAPGAWRKMLAPDQLPVAGPEEIHLDFPHWRLADSAIVAGLLVLSLVAVV
jgi:energy-coupling factor transporter transmembrane protein EcfT